jgi:hypothetical protein
VQDDTETKAQEINNMDKIYGNAFLTIIAATGDDAEAGLPGFQTDRTGTIRVIEQISPNLKLILSGIWKIEMLSTKYDSRAWTYVCDHLMMKNPKLNYNRYQERAAAPRRLYFLNGRVMFQCHWAYWTEDWVFEEHIFSRGPRRTEYPEESPDFAPPTYLEEIWIILYEYTNRGITFDSDTLLAFVGIWNILT